MRTHLISLFGAIALAACTSTSNTKITDVKEPSTYIGTGSADAQKADINFSIQYPMQGKYWFLARKSAGIWKIEQALPMPPDDIPDGQEVVTVSADLRSFAPWWPGQDAPKVGSKRNLGPDGVYYKEGKKFECVGALRANNVDTKFSYSPCGNTSLAKIDAGASIGRNVVAAVLTFGLAVGKNTTLNEDEIIKLSKDTNLRETARKYGINLIEKKLSTSINHYDIRSLQYEASNLDDAALNDQLKQKYDNLLKEDYERSYLAANSESSLERFINDYQNFDPQKLVPKAKVKLAEIQKKNVQSAHLWAVEQEKKQRVAREEEKKRKRIVGTRVCSKQLGERGTADMYAGHVEDSSETKLKIRVTVYPVCRFANLDCLRPIGERIIWKNIDEWYVCEKG